MKWRFTLHSSNCLNTALIYVQFEQTFEQTGEARDDVEDDVDVLLGEDGNEECEGIGQYTGVNGGEVLYRGGVTGARILSSPTVRRAATGSTKMARRLIGAERGGEASPFRYVMYSANINAGLAAETYGTQRTNGEVDVSGDDYSGCDEIIL